MTQPRPADQLAIQAATAVRAELESKYGTFGEYEPVEMATQVVAGLNIMISINVGGGQYIHVRVYRDLSGNFHLEGVQTGLTADDPLEYVN